MTRSRKQQKAIHAKKGRIVEVTKKFGIGDIPIGTKGTRLRSIGDRSVVKFRKGQFLVPKTKLKLVK